MSSRILFYTLLFPIFLFGSLPAGAGTITYFSPEGSQISKSEYENICQKRDKAIQNFKNGIFEDSQNSPSENKPRASISVIDVQAEPGGKEPVGGEQTSTQTDDTVAQSQPADSGPQNEPSPEDEESADEELDDDEELADDEYEDDEAYEDDEEFEEVAIIADPLVGFNRAMYVFNDRLYFWLLKPVSRAWGFVMPGEIRTCVKNAFYNIRFPVRFINSLLQAKFRKAGAEFGQFFINSTVGFAGIGDPAANYPSLNPSREDLGQTFAVWGAGNGAYLMIPFFGPSSIRDGLGRLGDTFLDPIWWAFDEVIISLAIRAGETVNDTSFRIGDYEALKEAALDPYVAIRDAYIQNRNKLIEE